MPSLIETWRFWRTRLPPAAPAPQRHEYRATWTALSETYPRALAHVIGDLSEDELRASGLATLAQLESTVGVNASDTILEIGCGVGRVGWALMPTWCVPASPGFSWSPSARGSGCTPRNRRAKGDI
jgi:hypothetical protein